MDDVELNLFAPHKNEFWVSTHRRLSRLLQLPGNVCSKIVFLLKYIDISAYTYRYMECIHALCVLRNNGHDNFKSFLIELIRHSIAVSVLLAFRCQMNLSWWVLRRRGYTEKTGVGPSRCPWRIGVLTYICNCRFGVVQIYHVTKWRRRQSFWDYVDLLSLLDCCTIFMALFVFSFIPVFTSFILRFI